MTFFALNKLTTAALFITTAAIAATSPATHVSYRGTERIEAQETVAFRASGRLDNAIAFRASGRLNTIATYRGSEHGSMVG